MIGPWVVMEIGCIECDMNSKLLGLFGKADDALAAVPSWALADRLVFADVGEPIERPGAVSRFVAVVGAGS